MRLFNSLLEIEGISGTVIALGNFDGVHAGHQELIARTVKEAGAANLMSAVFTFSNHPKNVLSRSKRVKSILYPDEKAAIIERLGVDYMFNIPFDSEIQHMEPVEFISKLLIKKLLMREACCGFNYRFGIKASGNIETLMKESIKKHFGIHVIEPVRIDGQVVSSSLIRKLIERGDVEACKRFMGRHYTMGGEVIVGNRLGKSIGFPTSNIIVDDSMVSPANGVYITNCVFKGKRYQSVTNVGVKPTTGVFEKNVETHIFDFDKEIYGKTIRIEFLKKTRDEKKFDSIEELTKQIARDCIMAKSFHREKGENLPAFTD